MADALIPLPSPVALEQMSLADAPDLPTAVAAGIAHGLAPREALKSAFGKWMTEHADAVQAFGLANFYDGTDAHRAMTNQTALLQYLIVMVDTQQRQIEGLKQQIATTHPHLLDAA